MKYTIYPHLINIGSVSIAGKEFDNFGSVWVFDDETTGLKDEGLISGMEQVIEEALRVFGIRDGVSRGFKLEFSDEHFEGANIVAEFVRTGDCREVPGYSGTWYSWDVEGKQIDGWLCPALFKYFHVAPAMLFAKVSSKSLVNRADFNKYITVFTGAGVSAESGIATFRATDGTWNNHRVEDVASPAGFQRDPQLVWDFYRGRWEQRQTVKPNAAHYAIANLEEQVEALGVPFVLITQNVDGLHQEAGSKHVLELHGDLRTLKCNVCQYRTDAVSYWQKVEVPVCPLCGANLRPNIVWFGEALDSETIAKAMIAAENSISMLMVGTSAQVYPAAQLPHMTLRSFGHLYECNPELALAHTQLTSFDELYHPYRGKATATVPEACKRILNNLLSKVRSSSQS